MTGELTREEMGTPPAEEEPTPKEELETSPEEREEPDTEEVPETPQGDEEEEGEEPSKEEPEAEEDDSETSPEDKEAKGQLPKGVKKRIGRALRDRDKARAESADLRQQIEELKAGKGKTETEELIEPKEDDFESYGDYVKALTKHEIAVAKKSEMPEDKGEEAAPESESQAAEYLADAIEDGREKFDDFDEVVLNENGKWALTTNMMMSAVESETPEEILYHLAKNPKESMKIAKLSPVQQVKEIGKLEARLQSKPPKTKKPPGAPPPIKPTKGAGAPKVNPRDLPTDKWIEDRNKEAGRH